MERFICQPANTGIEILCLHTEIADAPDKAVRFHTVEQGDDILSRKAGRIADFRD
jgi:hypothetical protein